VGRTVLGGVARRELRPVRRYPRRMVRSRVAFVVALLIAPLVALTACVPTKADSASEVDDGSASASTERTPPVFPSSGVIPVNLLVDGLVFDLTDTPGDRNLWVPDEPQARCAATGIVDDLGAPRLSELGYRPGTQGASLNEVALSDVERGQVADRFASCVNLGDAVGSLLMGRDQMSGTQAACIADGLEQRNLLLPFAEAFAFRQPVDPFAGDGALATAMLDYSAICLGDDSFTWLDANLPGAANGTAPAPTTTVPGQSDGLANRTGSAGG